MTAPTCTEVRDAAAEFALDILEPHERSAIAAHLLRCPDCRVEVDSMSAVGSRLLELIPGTEPPLGFDRRVLAQVVLAQVRPRRGIGQRLGNGRSRLLAGAAAVAAAVVLVFASLGWFSGGKPTHTPHAVLTAELLQGGHRVGEVYASSGSKWLSMTVHGASGADKVTCELVGAQGAVVPIGSFDLVDGSGSWGAPDPTGFAGVTGARLIDSTGHVIATATFH
jgi:hypothetical protein